MGSVLQAQVSLFFYVCPICYGRHAATAALDLPRLEPAPDYVPECLETGTQNHEGIVGAAAAVDFLANLASDATASRRERLDVVMQALHERGELLLRTLWSGLEAIDGVSRSRLSSMRNRRTSTAMPLTLRDTPPRSCCA